MTCAAARVMDLELVKNLSATCLMFEEIHQKKNIAKINVIR